MKNTEAFCPVTGGKIWYKIFGNNTNKPPLIIIHGGPGAPHNALINLKALANE